MNIIFYKPNSEEELLSFYSNISNRIPRIGETVLIKENYYTVESIITSYKTLEHDTYCVVSIWLKSLTLKHKNNE